MSATVPFTLTASPIFPQGTTVKLYRRVLFGGGPPQAGQAPVGTPVAASGVVDEHGYVAYPALVPVAGYYAGAQVAGVWMWKGFTTPGPPLTEGPEGPQGPQGEVGPESKAGEWVPLLLTAKTEARAGVQAPAVRLELGGSVIRLRGGVQVKTGETVAAGEECFRLPEGFRPPFVIGLEIVKLNATIQRIEIAANTGIASPIGATITTGNSLALDGVTFNLT